MISLSKKEIRRVNELMGLPKAWRVYRRGQHVDTVWFTGYTAEEVKASLVNHDGYPTDIRVIIR